MASWRDIDFREERIRCASACCTNVPLFVFEAGDVSSTYCGECKKKIEAQSVVREPGLIRTVDELKAVIDRRLTAAVELRAWSRENGETADWNWANGAVDELMIVQDLLCIILNQPRTYAAQR